MKSLILAALTIMATSASAEVLKLIDEPQGLAWSSEDVGNAGEAAAKDVLDKAVRLNQLGCQTHCDVIERVWSRLTVVFDEQQMNRAKKFALRLHVVQTPDIDAFAVPNGTLVLSESLLRENKLDDAQLAFVLAHEVAHVLLEHERQYLTATLSILPRDVPRTVEDVYVELAFNFGLVKALEICYQQAELEADQVGMQLAALAGYPPIEQLQFMKNEATHEQAGTAVLATHPKAQNRLDRLQEQLPLAQSLYSYGAKQRQLER